MLGNVTKFADRLLNRFRVMNARMLKVCFFPTPLLPPKEQGLIRVRL